jgi:hypothetical protein
MNVLNNFISKTIKPVLIIFGLLTCLPILIAINIELLPEFAQGIDFTNSSVPALRHWGFMVFGIGALLVAAAFNPQLRFSTMVFSTLEKTFMVYLWISNMNEPWGSAYLGMGILDSIICVYSYLYFISNQK